MKDKNKFKICLVIPYFGDFPNYFDLWLNSCEHNPEINFLIFTDNKEKYVYPSNVKVVNITFQELKEKIQSKFDFKICLSRPYKLCDYRPAYGYIFEEYLKDFDFWGHCDLDVIFGNLKQFLTKDILNNYEKIYKYRTFFFI